MSVPSLHSRIVSLHGSAVERIDQYLDAGVPLVWIVDTHFRTLTVFQPNTQPQKFNTSQNVSADPHLPGFQVSVAEFFED